MKNQALVSSKDKSKKLKCLLLQFLFGALRVNAFIPNVGMRSYGKYLYIHVLFFLWLLLFFCFFCFFFVVFLSCPNRETNFFHYFL